MCVTVIKNMGLRVLKFRGCVAKACNCRQFMLGGIVLHISGLATVRGLAAVMVLSLGSNDFVTHCYKEQ